MKGLAVPFLSVRLWFRMTVGIINFLAHLVESHEPNPRYTHII